MTVSIVRRRLAIDATAVPSMIPCMILALVLACVLLAGAAAPAVANDFATRGAEAKSEGRHEDALGFYEQALEAEPNDLRIGAEYRQLAIAAEAYDRAIAFFEALVAAHPEAPNAWLNYGFAYVDKVPVEGAITQVILANKALGYFSEALELEESWLGRYTRGNSYNFWPAIFGRAPKAVADLERAIELSEQSGEKKPFHARAWASLGDAHWRLDDLEKAYEIWREGLERFPDHPDLVARASREGDELDAFLDANFDAGARVATDLREIWEEAP